MSRRLGEQGRVLVRVFVDTSGAAAQIELRESSGHPRLDDAAASAVRRWRFVPARRGAAPGRPGTADYNAAPANGPRSPR
jgi:protein TonB